MTQVVKEDYYNYTDVFTSKQGLFIAFGLNWDGPEMPPQVGTLEIVDFSWHLDVENGAFKEV